MDPRQISLGAFAAALARGGHRVILAGPGLAVDLLLTAERPIEETEEALRSMMQKQALKVVIRP